MSSRQPCSSNLCTCVHALRRPAIACECRACTHYGVASLLATCWHVHLFVGCLCSYSSTSLAFLHRYTTVNDACGDPGSAPAPDDAVASIIANVAYSREVVRDVVDALRKQSPWKEDKIVQALGVMKGSKTPSLDRASEGYITGLLKRLNLHCRRVTSAAKPNTPSVPAIREHQMKLQASICSLPPEAVVSGDETVLPLAMPPAVRLAAEAAPRLLFRPLRSAGHTVGRCCSPPPL
jgi:hypothetical protein